jgi:hypothetical protein
MPPSPIPVPQILGHFYSFASIEVLANGNRQVGFTAINYSSSLDIGQAYGTKPQKLGRTRGKQNAEGSLEMYLQEWENLRATLGAAGVGYGEVPFDVIVTYAELNQPVKMDTLFACRITKVEYSNADGTDPAKVTATLDIMRLLEGGVGQIAAPLGVAL